MLTYRLAFRARLDIDEIFAWSFEHFGIEAAERYLELIDRSILDLAEDPARPGSKEQARPSARLLELSPLL